MATRTAKKTVVQKDRTADVVEAAQGDLAFLQQIGVRSILSHHDLTFEQATALGAQ